MYALSDFVKTRTRERKQNESTSANGEFIGG